VTSRRASRGDRVGRASHGTRGGSGVPGAEDCRGYYVEEGEGEVEQLLDCGDWHGQRPMDSCNEPDNDHPPRYPHVKDGQHDEEGENDFEIEDELLVDAERVEGTRVAIFGNEADGKGQDGVCDDDENESEGCLDRGMRGRHGGRSNVV